MFLKGRSILTILKKKKQVKKERDFNVSMENKISLNAKKRDVGRTVIHLSRSKFDFQLKT